MVPDDSPSTNRRRFLLATTAFAGGLAGCGALSNDDDSTTPTDRNAASTATTTDDGTPTAPSPATLRVGVAGDLSEVLQDVATVWNANEPPRRRFFRGEEVAIDVDGRVADHFCAAHGLERTDTANRPPLYVATVDVDDEEQLRSGLLEGHLDLATPGIPDGDGPAFEERFVGRVLGYGGHGCFVSPAIADASVTAVTNQQLREVYMGNITNWSTLGGPDREIEVVAGAASTPDRPFRQYFLEHAPADGVDVRFGRPSNRAEYISSRDDAFGELPIGAVTDSLPVLSVTDGGSTVGPRNEAYGPSYPLRCLTHGEPDRRERAVLDYFRSAIVQHRLAQDEDIAGYAPLSTVES